MDYKERVMDILTNKELTSEQEKQLENIFPELAESEDERIVKDIICYLQVASRYVPQFQKEEWIAWLEKHGESSSKTHYWKEEEIEPIISDYLRGAEHYGGMIARLRCLKPKSLEKKEIDYAEELKKCKDNPLYFFDKYVKVKLKEQKDFAPKVAPKFKVGDWITNGENVWKIGYIDDNMYIEHSGPVSAGGAIESIDKHYHLWTIQDAKDGDVLCTSNGNPFIFKKITKNRVYSYCGLFFRKFDETKGCVNGELAIELPSDYVPATKEQCDLLFSKMKEAGYKWDAVKKELKKIDARQNLTLDGDLMQADCMMVESSWSKEDEDISIAIENHLREYYVEKKGYPYVADENSPEMKEIRWLKSIRNRLK